jgi:hypothetical protein
MEYAMHMDSVHRRANGTVDIDFYRREAVLLRRQAGKKIFRRIGRLSKPLIGAATIVATYALVPPREPLPPSNDSLFVSANVPLLPPSK